MLKRILIGTLSVSLLVLCGMVLRALHMEAANDFRSLYASFEVISPKISHLFLSHIGWWPLMMVVLSILSMIPVCFFQRRIWLSIAVPVLGLLWTVGLTYAPTFFMASAI